MLNLSRFFHNVTNYLQTKGKLCWHNIALSFNCSINTNNEQNFMNEYWTEDQKIFV